MTRSGGPSAGNVGGPSQGAAETPAACGPPVLAGEQAAAPGWGCPARPVAGGRSPRVARCRLRAVLGLGLRVPHTAEVPSVLVGSYSGGHFTKLACLNPAEASCARGRAARLRGGGAHTLTFRGDRGASAPAATPRPRLSPSLPQVP